MTQERKSRLPREAEFQAKRKELTAVFGRLEALCKNANNIGTKWSRPVYVCESGEVFKISFESDLVENG